MLGEQRAARLRAIEDAVLSAEEGSPAPTGFDVGLAGAGVEIRTGADVLDQRLAPFAVARAGAGVETRPAADVLDQRLARFAEAVPRHAHRITDEDVVALRDAGVP